VKIHLLRQTGETNQSNAARLGIIEGAVRYHLRRQATSDKRQATSDKRQAMGDGRWAMGDGRTKLSLIEELPLAKVVNQWHADRVERLPSGRSPNLRSLWMFLVDDYAYSGLTSQLASSLATNFPLHPSVLFVASKHHQRRRFKAIGWRPT